MNLFLIRLDGTYARYDGVVASPEFVNLTGIGEPYRDIFQTTVQTSGGANDNATGLGAVQGAGSLTFPGLIDSASTNFSTSTGLFTYTQGRQSDEAATTPVPPRQGDQQYTFWQFDLGVVADQPRYIYAEFRRGDMIASNAPNTDPAV